MAMSGGMVAQYPLTKLVLQVGWREALQMVGWLGVAMLIVMMLWIKDRPEDVIETPRKKTNLLLIAKEAYFSAQTLRAAMYTSLMNMSVAVFGAMMGSLYLMQRLGVNKEDAAFVNSFLFLGAIVGGPLIGWCSDKLGVRLLPMKIGALAALGTFLVILYLPLSLGVMSVMFFLLGFFTASQVISYALVAESSSPNITAMAVSIISILTQGGYILYQNIFSSLLLWHGEMNMLDGLPVYSLGDYQTAALILPLGLIMAFLIVFRLKETYCRQLQG